MPVERYFIGPGLRDKLRETITRVDGMQFSEGEASLPSADSPMQPRAAMHLCKTTAAWSKNSSQTLTVYKGTPGAETADTGFTVVAWNKTRDVDKNKWVLVGRANATYYLVEAEGGHIRLGTISATWNKGAFATVTQQNGDGTAMDGNPTFSAMNYFAVASGTKRVACAKVDDTWILIAAEC